MNLILTVLQIVAPVGLLGLTGFVWVKAGFEYRMEFVTRLAMTLATPCLMFTALMKTEVDPASLAAVALAASACFAALALIWWGFVTVTGLERRTYMAPMIFGNTGNVGLPIALFGFGEIGLGYGVAIFAVSCIWSFTLGAWLMTRGGSVWAVLREPVVGATLLGAVFLWQGWQTPLWITTSLDLIGQMAIPMMLITLGVSVARISAGRLGRAVLLSILRMGVSVAVAVVVGYAFALEPVAFAVLVLQISTPVAVTIYMLAARHGADADAVAGLVIASTLLAVLGIPLTLAFLI